MTKFFAAFNFATAGVCAASVVIAFDRGANTIGDFMISLVVLNIVLGVANLKQ
jgi:hypothetical protein